MLPFFPDTTSVHQTGLVGSFQKVVFEDNKPLAFSVPSHLGPLRRSQKSQSRLSATAGLLSKPKKARSQDGSGPERFAWTSTRRDAVSRPLKAPAADRVCRSRRSRTRV
jgi:hypothetical protein